MFVALFHSMFGLRAVELSAAERLRAAGHHVVLPDLFAGATVAGELDAGLSLMGRVGWDTIVQRAHDALADVPAEAVLGGFSMGVGVVGALWPERLEAAGAFLLHAPTLVPPGLRAGAPVQLHVGASDPFAPPDQLVAFRDSAERAGAAASAHQYPGVGHFFTDVTLPEYDAVASASTWKHVVSLLDAVS
ncbi:MAG TPA: dienelactone hydrolase family protein [Jatrophihabitantaceae bacterium]